MPKLKEVVFFLFLLFIVVFIQNEFLNLALKLGLKPDDWILYFYYKVLGNNPLSNAGLVWAQRGAYTTYQVYYIGFLGDLIGFNWQAFHQINIYFKILATISLYPLILIVFRNRTLAVLSTIIYAVSYSSIGPLEFVVKGSDYLAIFWMHIFLLIYYLIVRHKLRGIQWLIISAVLLILTIVFSPIRLYPLLLILPLVEIYLLIIKYKFTSIKIALLRLLVLYLPYLLLIFYSPGAVLGYFSNPLDIVKSGVLQSLLTPLSGVGYLFITNQYFGRVFGSISTNSFSDYFIFLLGGPLVIFGGLTLFLGYLRVNQPVRFSLIVLFLTFLAESLIYSNIQKYNDRAGSYAVLVGVYILVLSVAVFVKWVRTRYTDTLLAALALGGFFSIIFTLATWMPAPTLVRFSGASYYLVVASLGGSIFISAILTSIFEKFQSTKVLPIRLCILIIGLAVLTLIFSVNINEIEERLISFNLNGLNLEQQQQLQDRFKSALDSTANLEKALFFFDTSELSENGQFYSEGFLVSFPFWMHFDGNNLRDGCLEVIYENKEKALLKKIVKITANERGFYYRGLCLENGRWGYQSLLYKPENFYAFKIKNGDFIDIKNEVIKELELE